MDHKKYTRISLLTNIIISFSATIAFLLIFTLIHYTNHKNNVYEQTCTTQLNAATDENVTNLWRTVEHITDELTLLSLQITSPADFQTMLHQYIKETPPKKRLGTLNLISPNDFLNYDKDSTLSHTEKNIIKDGLSGKTFSYYLDEKQPQFYFYVPVTFQANEKGFLTVNYSSEQFLELLTSMDPPPSTTALLSSANYDFLTPTKSSITSLQTLLHNATLKETADYDSIMEKIKQSEPISFSYELYNTSYYTNLMPTGYDDLYCMTTLSDTMVKEQLTDPSLLNDHTYIILIVIIFLLLLFIISIQIYTNSRVKKEQLELNRQTTYYKALFEHSNDVFWEYTIATDTFVKSDPDNGLSLGLASISNFKQTVLDMNIIYPDDIDIFLSFYNSLRHDTKTFSYELRAKDLSGNYQWFELFGSCICDNNNEPYMVLGQTLNINKTKMEIENLKETSQRDPLTKLYNRQTLMNLINESLEQEQRSTLHCLMLIDIDNFKFINDSFGYVFGDAVLIELTNQLTKRYKHNGNLIGRIGGDEFVVFIHNVTSISSLDKECEEILALFTTIYTSKENEQKISASIGLSLFSINGIDYETLLNKADIALYYAKQKGKGSYALYDPKTMNSDNVKVLSNNGAILSKSRLENDRAIDNSVISNAIDILFDARELKTSINMILSLIGNYYNLNYICIVEFNESISTANLSYQWRDNDTSSFLDNVYSVDISKAKTDSYRKEYHNGIYYSNNIKMNSNATPLILNYQKLLDICGCLECAIYEDGIYQGYLGFTFREEGRIWKPQEVNTISMIAKIIGGYLIKLNTQAKMNYMENRDPLTGCYNLFSFTKRAYELLNQYSKTNYMILYSDIDKFKLFNETYGYNEGDRILKEFALIVREMLNPEEAFGRITADKFVALLVYDNEEIFLDRLKLVNEKMNRIKKTDTDYYRISLITGMYPTNKVDNISLAIDRANIARKSIQNRHKSKFAHFDESMKSALFKQKEIEDVMEEALLNEEFQVYYQPKFLLASNTICGAEALVRWQKPNQELIPPNEFIPIFEDNRFIISLDFYVFEFVCKHIRHLLDNNKKVYPISVNFSRVHLTTTNMVQRLKEILQKYNIPAKLIEIELTESAFINNECNLHQLLWDLHKLGFLLSMDDFGSGLSSLNILRELPFDIIKLDKDFFQHGSSTSRERIIIRNIVKMAAELNILIISEGVETEEQADFLRSINCTIAQGYLFAKPMPVKDYEQLYIV